MCGFTGLFDRTHHSPDHPKIIEHMLNSIAHRGPDDHGIWTDPEAGIALGHRRLSILDLSPLGHQPMLSSCERWVITYNGEIYNYQELRRELESHGWDKGWRGHSDTEVLLAAISLYGVKKALTKCVGMFAFALWDRAQKTLTLARDRMGEKPLYYGWMGKTFLFASELSSLYKHPQWQGEINRNALSLLMRHNYIPAPYSIFSNISKLQPAHILTLAGESREPQIECYWDIHALTAHQEAHPFQGTAEEAVQLTENYLKQSLAGQMLADVPLGAFLSGGIDSSTIVALMQSMSSQPVKTFTIGFNEIGYNEAVHAKAVANHLKTDHTELYVSPQETLNVIPKLPTIYSEPFADSSQIPTFLVSQLGRQSVTVCLSGDGGDELFSGYTRYALSESLWKRVSLFPRFIRSGLSTSLQNLSPSTWNKILTPFMHLLPKSYRFHNPGDKLHKLSYLLPLQTQNEMYKHLISHWESPTDLVYHSRELSTMVTQLASYHPSSFVRNMMYKDMISYLPDDILTKVDRASMAVSLESRVPLLDHRLVEFSLSLPLDILRKNGQTKWPLRQILYRYVPQSLIDRPKMGFGIPLDHWLRGPLKEWGEALLHADRLKSEGYFNSDLVTSTWNSHQSGKTNCQYQLWNILMFQAWLEHYKEIK